MLCPLSLLLFYLFLVKLNILRKQNKGRFPFQQNSHFLLCAAIIWGQSYKKAEEWEIIAKMTFPPNMHYTIDGSNLKKIQIVEQLWNEKAAIFTIAHHSSIIDQHPFTLYMKNKGNGF